MNAIKLLKKQHRDVKKLMVQAQKTASAKERQELALEIADQLTVHATLEEKIFYPAVMSVKNEDQLREAVEEHLGVKRILADLMKAEAGDPQLRAKLTVLMEEVRHHVEEEEEKTLFPRVEKTMDAASLNALGAQMEAMMQALLAKGAPRENVMKELAGPAPLSKPEPARSPTPKRSVSRRSQQASL